MIFNNQKKKITENAKKIKILFIDVDGVMTDGGKYYLADGTQIRKFNAQDGYGIELWHGKGLKTCVISDDTTGIVERRAKDLGINFIITGTKEKLMAFERVLKENGLKKEESAYIGDDILDLPVMKKAGLSAAVNNAVDDARKTASCITSRKGGEGAVRELIDFMLSAKG